MHPSQIVRLVERKIVGRLGLSHCSQPSRIMLQHVTTLCACHGRLPSIGLFGDAKQAMGEGKSGPVETGLTGPVATTLHCDNDVPVGVEAPPLYTTTSASKINLTLKHNH